MKLLHSWIFWWLACCTFCLFLERVNPWRKQKFFRKEITQDFLFFILNGHYIPVFLACYFTSYIEEIFLGTKLGIFIESQRLFVDELPFLVQIFIILIAKDFLEYLTHYCLHRFSFLWRYHKLHHSILELDWIGNYRFHYMEILVYKTTTWFPFFILIPNVSVFLWVGVISTLIGCLNHTNFALNLGPLRYVINSAPLHVWHHDIVLHKPYGQNFGVVFSFWDVLFGTWYQPSPIENPSQIGYKNQQNDSSSFIKRLYPWQRKTKASK
jgi:sterol desaturase/sphingolipid hydroxylase (fatty acid hydroxylase superfamily)